MSQDEVLQLLTKHARGLTKEEVISVVGVEKGVSKTVKDEKEITPKDQIAALKELNKRYVDLDKFKFEKEYKNKQLDHNIETDKKRLELEEKKYNTDSTDEDNKRAIREFIEATKADEEELDELFEEELNDNKTEEE
jgi:hypothetical protein